MPPSSATSLWSFLCTSLPVKPLFLATFIHAGSMNNVIRKLSSTVIIVNAVGILMNPQGVIYKVMRLKITKFLTAGKKLVERVKND